MSPITRTQVFRCSRTHLMLPMSEHRPAPKDRFQSTLGLLWTNVNQRAVNGRYADNRRDHYPNNSHHRRGIRIYEAWINDPTAFGLWILTNIGLPPAPEYSLDRIDNDGDYVPGNLRWADPLTQVRNKGERHVA